jgi:hypothetical protein
MSSGTALSKELGIMGTGPSSFLWNGLGELNHGVLDNRDELVSGHRGATVKEPAASATDGHLSGTKARESEERDEEKSGDLHDEKGGH